MWYGLDVRQRRQRRVPPRGAKDAPDLLELRRTLSESLHTSTSSRSSVKWPDNVVSRESLVDHVQVDIVEPSDRVSSSASAAGSTTHEWPEPGKDMQLVEKNTFLHFRQPLPDTRSKSESAAWKGEDGRSKRSVEEPEYEPQPYLAAPQAEEARTSSFRSMDGFETDDEFFGCAGPIGPVRTPQVPATAGWGLPMQFPVRVPSPSATSPADSVQPSPVAAAAASPAVQPQWRSDGPMFLPQLTGLTGISPVPAREPPQPNFQPQQPQQPQPNFQPQQPQQPQQPPPQQQQPNFQPQQPQQPQQFPQLPLGTNFTPDGLAAFAQHFAQLQQLQSGAGGAAVDMEKLAVFAQHFQQLQAAQTGFQQKGPHGEQMMLVPAMISVPVSATGASSPQILWPQTPAIGASDATELTLMVRNIPNKYRPDMLLECFAEWRPSIDFYYMPTDFKNNGNLGYAFVNFHDVAAARRFIAAFNGVQLPLFKQATKVLAVSEARVQGKVANVERFRNSSVMGVLKEEFKPLIFDLNGVPLPFPKPDAALPAAGPRFRRR